MKVIDALERKARERIARKSIIPGILLHVDQVLVLCEVVRAAEILVRYTNRDYAEWRDPVEKALAKLKEVSGGNRDAETGEIVE